MIRYAIVLLAAMGTIAAAAAFQDAPAGTLTGEAAPARNVTVIEKNSPFPVLDTQGWIACQTDDCSDVPEQ